MITQDKLICKFILSCIPNKMEIEYYRNKYFRVSYIKAIQIIVFQLLFSGIKAVHESPNDLPLHTYMIFIME